MLQLPRVGVEGSSPVITEPLQIVFLLLLWKICHFGVIVVGRADLIKKKKLPFGGKMCVFFVSRPMKIVTFPYKQGEFVGLYPPVGFYRLGSCGALWTGPPTASARMHCAY